MENHPWKHSAKYIFHSDNCNINFNSVLNTKLKYKFRMWQHRIWEFDYDVSKVIIICGNGSISGWWASLRKKFLKYIAKVTPLNHRIPSRIEFQMCCRKFIALTLNTTLNGSLRVIASTSIMVAHWLMTGIFHLLTPHRPTTFNYFCAEAHIFPGGRLW